MNKLNSKSKMKVALIVPKSTLHLSTHGAPMNLCHIASYLRKTLPNVDIRIFDGSIGDEPEKCISEFRPDVVGVTATTPQAPAAYRLGDSIKKNWPDVLTVIGGIHASVLPKEALEHFDIVVVGEGEKTFSQIVQRCQNKQSQHGIIEAEPLENLDDIPIPAIDLIKLQYYLQHGINLPTLKPPVLGMVTSRGCPYRCAFCWNSFRKNKVRYFSAKRIVEEILFLREKYGVDKIYFLDDEFLINTERIKELSTLFKKYGISKWLKWACSARATTVNVPLLKMVKDMGCVMVLFGLESGTERMLRYLKSGSASVSANEKALDIAAQAGLPAGGSFIFGTPTETLEEMKETFNWILTHKTLKFVGISILAPYPGTKVWDLCNRRGLLPEKINYERIIQDASPEINTFFVTTVPQEAFVRFMKDVNRTTWFLSEVRPQRSVKKFVFMLGVPTVWRVIANHPRVVMTELMNIVKSRECR